MNEHLLLSSAPEELLLKKTSYSLIASRSTRNGLVDANESISGLA